MDRVENMREVVARMQCKLCRCGWFGAHLCAVRGDCTIHFADELDYAVQRYGPAAIQLRLF